MEKTWAMLGEVEAHFAGMAGAPAVAQSRWARFALLAATLVVSLLGLGVLSHSGHNEFLDRALDWTTR